MTFSGAARIDRAGLRIRHFLLSKSDPCSTRPTRPKPRFRIIAPHRRERGETTRATPKQAAARSPSTQGRTHPPFARARTHARTHSSPHVHPHPSPVAGRGAQGAQAERVDARGLVRRGPRRALRPPRAPKPKVRAGDASDAPRRAPGLASVRRPRERSCASAGTRPSDWGTPMRGAMTTHISNLGRKKIFSTGKKGRNEGGRARVAIDKITLHRP